MKIALIADIHGNLAALDAVLAAISQERPDEIVCLGDVAATGPWPREVLVQLRAIGCLVVLGNADDELLHPRPTARAGDDERRIREIDDWCAAQLDAADRAFIASFPPTIAFSLGPGRRLLCCHGSPRSFNDVIRATTPDEALVTMIAGHEGEVIAGGHTHARMLRQWRGREIINPGSVGLAYEFMPDGSVRIPPWAEFALLSDSDEGALSVDFRRVPYDRAATVRAMFERGMPHAAWWSAGWE